MIATTICLRKQVMNYTFYCSAAIANEYIHSFLNSGSEILVVVRCLLRVIVRLLLVSSNFSVVVHLLRTIISGLVASIFRSAVLRDMKH